MSNKSPSIVVLGQPLNSLDWSGVRQMITRFAQGLGTIQLDGEAFSLLEMLTAGYTVKMSLGTILVTKEES